MRKKHKAEGLLWFKRMEWDRVKVSMTARQRWLQWREVHVTSNWQPRQGEGHTSTKDSLVFYPSFSSFKTKHLQGLNPAEYHTPTPISSDQVISSNTCCLTRISRDTYLLSKTINASQIRPLLERDTNSRRYNTLFLPSRSKAGRNQ